MAKIFLPSEWLAKSLPKNTSLNKHLKETLFEAINLCKKFELAEVENLAAQFSAAFHDFGKCDNRFQEKLRGRPQNISHALLSLSAAAPIARQIFGGNELIKNAVLWSIASHHSAPSPNLFSTQSDSYFELQTDEQHAKKLSKEICEWLNINPEITIEKNVKKTLLELKNWTRNLKLEESKEFRNVFVNIQGILNIADYNASGASIDPRPQYNLTDIFKSIQNPYQHQLNAMQITGNAIARLPTGSGKTETAFAWAANNAEYRVFYLLPTQATLNTMKKRALGFAGKNDIALVHSNANIVEYLNVQESDSQFQYDAFFAQQSLAKLFGPKLVFCTPDQILLSLYNHGRYAPKNLMFKNAAIIIDEIHSYDPVLFMRIVDALKILKGPYYQCKFFFMSATLPSVLKRELKFLNPKNVVNLNSEIKLFKRKKRTKPIIEHKNIQECLSSAIQQVQSGKRVLIVTNTVGIAQKLYQRTEKELNDKVLLFHSQFIVADKYEKEKTIMRWKEEKKPHLLIATQVVEVSLDVDYENLYTEVAPIDTLTQRFGRLNRYGTNEGIEGIIFIDKNKEAEYPYQHLINDSNSVLKENIENYHNEWDYVRWNEEYYQRIWEPIIKEKLIPKTAELLSEVENNYWKKKSGIFRMELTEENGEQRLRGGLSTIKVLPNEFLEQAKEKFSQKEKNKEKQFENYIWLANHIVNISLWKKNNIYKETLNGKIDINVWKGSYTSKLGLGLSNNFI